MDDSINKVVAQLQFGITGALQDFQTLEKQAALTAQNIKSIFAQTTLTSAGGATAPMTAQQAMVAQIAAQGEARKAAIVAEGEAKITAIQAREALTRQGIAQKEAVTQMAIARQQVEQERLLYMQSRRAAFDEHAGSFGNLIARHGTWIAAGAALFGTFEMLKEGLVDVETGMKGLVTVLPELHGSQEAYNDASRQTIDLMQKLGSNLDETMTAARSFGRMYKDVETVMGLTNDAILLNVIDQVRQEAGRCPQEGILLRENPAGSSR